MALCVDRHERGGRALAGVPSRALNAQEPSKRPWNDGPTTGLYERFGEWMSFNHASRPLDTIYICTCTARRLIAPDAFGARTGRHDPFGNEATEATDAVSRSLTLVWRHWPFTVAGARDGVSFAQTARWRSPVGRST